MSRKPNPTERRRLRHIVASDPEIMGGTPVFRGTRIPVDLIADMLAQGASAEEILEGYPTLDKGKIAMATPCTRAFPAMSDLLRNGG